VPLSKEEKKELRQQQRRTREEQIAAEVDKRLLEEAAEEAQRKADQELQGQLPAMIEAYATQGNTAEPLLLPAMGQDLRRIAYTVAKEHGLHSETQGFGQRKAVVLSVAKPKLVEKQLIQQGASKKDGKKLTEAEVEAYYKPCMMKYADETEEYIGILPSMNSFERRSVYMIAESLGLQASSRGDGGHKDVVLTRSSSS